MLKVSARGLLADGLSLCVPAAYVDVAVLRQYAVWSGTCEQF